MRGAKWAKDLVKRGQNCECWWREQQKGGERASWHIYSFAYYFAAVLVCLLMKDNPIKALKSSLTRRRHKKHTSLEGLGLGERTGCGALCKACSFHPSLVSTSGASGQRARGLRRWDHNMPPWLPYIGSGTGQSPAFLHPPAVLSCRVLADCIPSAHMPTYTVFSSN